MEVNSFDKYFSSRYTRLFVRVVILYLISTIFKSFDQSFIADLSVFNLRGHMFSIVYVLYGLLAWEGAIMVAKWAAPRFTQKKFFLLAGYLLTYGVVASYIFGLTYAVFDIVFFHRYEAWESVSHFSWDLIFGTWIFYLLLLTVNGIMYYYKAWKENQLQTERLMRENIQAKYDALRNQIDPHFFFNSLSVLTNLVYKSPDLAADYITQLAKTYRYILDKKFENLVPIRTELDFLESYLFLIRIRHQNSIRFHAEIDDSVKLKGLIPPATLQLLVENAIKHNRFSANDPLLIEVKSKGDSLVITNQLRARLHPETPSGIGLENIHKRYELAIGKGIEVIPSPDTFTVKIPVILS
ncbi:sensor histidine kinase [Chitinophaga rhizosphaerae]|uniref:sensor histidine kinase n=1 Tax=Chitinophaga rhizosphaerae TaxID=1864947 RepID=UPI000F7FB574|nr:histidine kinase [Chitinophaga rhizosphaerae]